MLDDQREAGRIPRTIECELTYGLGMYVTRAVINHQSLNRKCFAYIQS